MEAVETEDMVSTSWQRRGVGDESQEQGDSVVKVVQVGVWRGTGSR